LRTPDELAEEMRSADCATVEELVAASFREWPETPVPLAQ
jgi:hypothetical protein